MARARYAYVVPLRKPERIVRALRKLGIDACSTSATTTTEIGSRSEMAALRDWERITRACKKLGWTHRHHSLHVDGPLFTVSYYGAYVWVLYGRGALEGWSVARQELMDSTDPAQKRIAARVDRLLYVQRL